MVNKELHWFSKCQIEYFKGDSWKVYEIYDFGKGKEKIEKRKYQLDIYSKEY